MSRNRVLVLVVAGLVCLGAATGYLVWARDRIQGQVAQVATGPTLAPAQVLAGPHIVFRNSVLGADLGRLAAVPVSDPGGARAVLTPTCERSYAVRGAGVCVFAKRGVVQSYGVATLDENLTEVSRTELSGLPSRARMSPDGSLVATTTFITGHSYASSSFSTETIIRRSGRSLGNIETWATTVDGRALQAVDRNYWGVTFGADNDTFYATVASGGKTWLVKGSVEDRTMTSVGSDAECPSLSPDGSKVAYKKRIGNKTAGVWRLAVRDLASGRETLSSETRSVDDQVEWLDESHILYALPRSGSEATTSDVWVAPADGAAAPTVLVPQASSPAVVR